jgi:hypothetical protein
MAVTQVGSTFTKEQTGPTTGTTVANVTDPGGDDTNKILVAVIGIKTSVPFSISQAKYNGVDMSSRLNYNFTYILDRFRLALYTFDETNDGSFVPTASVTFAWTAGGTAFAGVFWLDGVDLSSPVSGSNQAAGVTPAPSVNVVGTSDGLSVGACFPIDHSGNLETTTADATEIIDGEGVAVHDLNIQTKAIVGASSMTWSNSNLYHIRLATNFIAAPVAAAFTPQVIII